MTMLIKQAACQLVIIDVQTKLSTAMPTEGMQQLLKNTQILAQAAQLLAIPTVVTEQYPQGLGATLTEIKQYCESVEAVAKTAFSACAEPRFNQQLHRDRPQIIITGMEAHICVLQTALDLVAMGKQVFVVDDAIISRSSENKANAVARMRDVGCVVTNTESVLFECLAHAQHEAFKTLSKLIR
jgi:nicotinamidase-related amidase